MKKLGIAKICWVKPRDGGRSAPPPGPKYSTAARFDSQNDWPDNAWSVVIEFVEQPNRELVHNVLVSFLSDEAPKEFLGVGRSFELMEGWKVVAVGEVTQALDNG